MTRIVMDLKRAGHVISPLIYGQFIEHLGGCVYDGIWVGPESEIANVGGMRCDTIEALRRLEIPVMRWPGGLWADQYDWRDGIGPRNARPVRQNLGWDAVESNAFGTHEFMAFCRAIGTEPFLCVNMGSGTVGLARDWAEYCNCAVETTWTRQRAANGDKKPFGVKYWGLGNEPFYTLDGRMRNVYYADLARNYAGFIKHVASQSHSNTSEAFRGVKMIWAVSGDEQVVGNLLTTPPANELVDMLSIHFYAGRPPLPEKPEDPGVWRMREYRRAIGDLVKFEGRIEESAEWARKLSTEEHTCKVAVDEWGTWYREGTPENRLVQRITLGDALFAAGCLHVMQRHEAVAMANLAQTVNVLTALIQTRGQEFVKTVMYDLWEMFRPHKGARFVPVEVEPPLPRGWRRRMGRRTFRGYRLV